MSLSPAQKIEKLIDRIMGMFVGGVGDNPVCQKDADDSDRAEEIIRGALRVYMSQNYEGIFEE
jgi:hypothetical protein